MVGGGNTTFEVISTGGLGYSGSSNDVAATYSTNQVLTNPGISPSIYQNTYTVSTNPTDATWALCQNFTVGSKLILLGSHAQYAIGAAPSSFNKNNIPGTLPFNPKDFGIYFIQDGKSPNLVAEISTLDKNVNATQLTSLLTGSFIHGSGDLTVAGTPVNGSNGGLGYNQFTWTTGQDPNLQTAGLNYLGYGEMWSLSGSAFEKFVL